MNINPSIEQLQAVIKSKGYRLFGDGRAYHLNIGGIRNIYNDSNKFDDTIYVFYQDLVSKAWIYFNFKGTTEPGDYYLINPMHPTGTWILAEGQYIGCYQKGLHRGEYPALVQCGGMDFHIDNDRDNKAEAVGPKVKGVIGCNVHRANPNPETPSTYVKNWSAACQVLASAKDFNVFMDLVNKSIENGHTTFSYTLLSANDFK